MSLRLIFMGTPAFAVPTLTKSSGRGMRWSRATRARRPGGRRGLDLVKSPVHQAAERFGIPVLTPKTLRNAEAQAEFASFGADAAIVVAYGLILPVPVLKRCRWVPQSPRFGAPRWRGAAPIQRAIMAGDKETAVMVMKMEEGLDTGPVGMAERIAISPDMTAGQLHDRMMVVGADLMVRALAALARGSLGFTPQASEGITYAAKITKEECRIDFSRPAADVHNHIRGLSPAPGAYFEIEGRRVKVLRAALVEGSGAAGTVIAENTIACGSGAIRLLEVQPAAKA